MAWFKQLLACRRRQDYVARADHHFGHAIAAFVIAASFWVLFAFTVCVFRLVWSITWQEAVDDSAVVGLVAILASFLAAPYIGVQLGLGIAIRLWVRKSFPVPSAS